MGADVRKMNLHFHYYRLKEHREMFFKHQTEAEEIFYSFVKRERADFKKENLKVV